MRKIFKDIWDLSLPYQDKRDDEGHAKITLFFAQKLLKTHKGDEDVIIPAIILHDIGWSKIPRKKNGLFLIRKPNKIRF